MKRFKILFLGLIIGGCFFVSTGVNAQDFFYLKSVKYPLNLDYSISSPDDKVKVNITEGSTSQNTLVKMMNIVKSKRIKNFFTYSSGLTPATDLYFLKFSNPDNFNVQPQITINYDLDDSYKEVYYYSWMDLRFVKIETTRDPLRGTLTFDYPEGKRSLMFAAFNEPEIVGKASWYVYPKYRGEMITASRDFAKGSQLLVTNLHNDNQVVVTVRDYGPKLCADWTEEEQRLMGPCQERVLDLSKTAFIELAGGPKQGIINQVKVTPLGEDQITIAND
jgi:hypothetical protein